MILEEQKEETKQPAGEPRIKVEPIDTKIVKTNLESRDTKEDKQQEEDDSSGSSEEGKSPHSEIIHF